MARGRPADPGRERRGTGHRPTAGKKPPAKVPAESSLVWIEKDTTPGLPPAPADLPDGAVGLWDTVVDELWPRGLRPADLEGIRMLVMAAYRNRQAEQLIDEFGILVDTAFGPKVNPALRVAKDTRGDYLRLADAFGLTLAARLRLGLMQIAGESLLSTLRRELDGTG